MGVFTMAKYVYVDNSNIWIEGKFHSAVDKGMIGSVQEAHEYNLCDMEWRYDFGKLLNVAVDGDTSSVERAVLFGSTPPDNDTLWRLAKAAGFEPKTLPRNSAGKEKGVDTSVVVKIMEDLYTAGIETNDEIVIVAGDADYVPVANAIRGTGRRLIVVFWSNVSAELKNLTDKFIDLNQHLHSIEFK